MGIHNMEHKNIWYQRDNPNGIIEEDSSHDEGERQNLIFAKWMDIIYLFDLRLIDSNLFL